MIEIPIVRFAPSPTGYFHVGGARTALFNWLFAKQHGGKFILRIEDTDEARNKEEWVGGICRALEWLGITWDLGPIRQSERTDLYIAAAERLYEAGTAYYCDCRREDVEERNRVNARPPGYDGYCRDRRLPKGSGSVLRFRVPSSGSTEVEDIVRGKVEFENAKLDDFVLQKGNGSPLFILANVVDDADMGVTHVIRAEEHLPTTPKAVLLYGALSLSKPKFAHVPVLVNEKRQKLSKRRDRVAVEDFKEQGFLSEAMVNYLALLGWSPKDDREFLTMDDLLESFSLEQVGRSPSFFDVVKMTHFNKYYISQMSTAAFVAAILPFLSSEEYWNGDEGQLGIVQEMAPLIQERISLLSEAPAMLEFFFRDPAEDNERFEALVGESLSMLSLTKASLIRLSEWSHETLEGVMRDLSESAGISLRKLQAPLRIAITGRKVGPPLFQSMELLGRVESMARISARLESRDTM